MYFQTAMAGRRKIKKQPIYACPLIPDEVIGWEAPEKEIKIVRCEKGEADKLISANHYSHKPTKNSFLSFLIYYKDEVKGALQLGSGIRPKIKGGYPSDDVREFDRMWLSDEMPKYSETITLSLLHHFLRSQYPQIKHLISYADTSVGNEGIIYQAANYRLEKVTKADFYILADGERVHPVTMWHRHKTRKWDLLKLIYPDIRKAEGYQKMYVFDL